MILRTPWSQTRWEAFACRCRIARDRLDTLVSTFPETRGLKPSHINALIDAHAKFVSAMVPLESLCAEQHPSLDPVVIRFIHGERGTFTWGPCRGQVRRDEVILSRERWTELGREFQAIHTETRAIIRELRTCSGRRSRQRVLERFEAADRSIGRAKSKFDDLLARQHSDWPEFSHVFFGSKQSN